MVLHAQAAGALERSSTKECDKFSLVHSEIKTAALGRKLSCFQSLLCAFMGIFLGFCGFCLATAGKTGLTKYKIGLVLLLGI